MIEAPDLSLAALAPLLFVFGAACVGVLVEAFGPRDARHPVQVAARARRHRSARWSARCCSPAPARSPPAARSPSTAPGLFLQATIAGLGALAILLFAERSLDPARSAFVTSAAVPAGSPRDRELLTSERVQTEVYPLATFAIGGMMLFVAVERPADHVRRARGAQPAAVPDLRPGPPAPAAVAGGGGQVLPPRRLRLGLLPVRAGAGLRRHRQRPAQRHPRRASVAGGSDILLVLGLALLIVGLLFKASVAPFHTWTPDVYQGAPTPVTAFMAACTKVAAFGAILRLLYVAFGTGEWTWRPLIYGVAIVSMIVGAVLGLTQTDLKRMLAYSSIAHAGLPADRRHRARRRATAPASRPRCSTCSPTG